MTADARHIIEDFEALPDGEKQEVLAQLLRIARDIEYEDTAEDDLTAAADEIFLDYDRREAND